MSIVLPSVHHRTMAQNLDLKKRKKKKELSSCLPSQRTYQKHCKQPDSHSGKKNLSALVLVQAGFCDSGLIHPTSTWDGTRHRGGREAAPISGPSATSVPARPRGWGVNLAPLQLPNQTESPDPEEITENSTMAHSAFMWVFSVVVCLFVLFCFFRAAPAACGGSQVKGLNQSCNCQPTPQPRQCGILASATHNSQQRWIPTPLHKARD